MERIIKYSKLSLIAFSVALVFASCNLNHYELNLPLAVSRDEIKINYATAGKTYFIVYSTGSWEIVPQADYNWVRLSATSGSKQKQIDVYYDNNYDMSREASFVVKSGNLQHTVVVSQVAGTTDIIYFNLPYSSVDVLKEQIPIQMSYISTVPEANMKQVKFVVNYSGQTSDWIKDIRIANGWFSFSVDENASSADRDAVININFPNAYWDAVKVTQSLKVSQLGASASMGELPESIVADPDCEKKIEIQLKPNYSPEFYTYFIDYKLKDAEGKELDWVSGGSVDEYNLFTAEVSPNLENETRTATLWMYLKDSAGTIVETRSTHVSQDKSDVSRLTPSDNTSEEKVAEPDDF